MAPVGERLAVLLSLNAASRVKLYESGGKLISELALPDIGSVPSFQGRWMSKEAFFSFESFHIPETIYRYDIAKNTQEVWARREVPIESGKYEVKQDWYASKDGTKIPKSLVAKYWVPEYASPDDPEQFKSILAYSPYQHVTPGAKYPPVLLVSGNSDTRVAPLHARKMAARLQAATSSVRPVLLHYDTKTGHSGGMPVSKQVDDLTNELAFLRWQLGVSPAPPGN